jgi:hypothetical protein
MVDTSTLALAAGGLAAAEALGVTNLSGGGGGGDDEGTSGQQPIINLPTPGGGGVTPGLGGPLQIEVPGGGGGSLAGMGPLLETIQAQTTALTQAAQGGGGGGGPGGMPAWAAELFAINQGRATDLEERIKNMTATADVPRMPGARTPFGDDLFGGGQTSQDAETGGTPSFFEGVFGMEAPDPAGYTEGQASGAGGFLSENPFFSAGTAAGAVLPDPITTSLGAGAGGLAEVAADTATGGTPLGVQSPADYTDPDTYTNFGSQVADAAGSAVDGAAGLLSGATQGDGQPARLIEQDGEVRVKPVGDGNGGTQGSDGGRGQIDAGGLAEPVVGAVDMAAGAAGQLGPKIVDPPTGGGGGGGPDRDVVDIDTGDLGGGGGSGGSAAGRGGSAGGGGGGRGPTGQIDLDLSKSGGRLVP